MKKYTSSPDTLNGFKTKLNEPLSVSMPRGLWYVVIEALAKNSANNQSELLRTSALTVATEIIHQTGIIDEELLMAFGVPLEQEITH